MIQAVTQFPYMIGGRNRFCTDMMKACNGKVIGKLGAAGVYQLGLPGHGIGCAVKIDDGLLHGPHYAVATEFIKWSQLMNENELNQLEKFIKVPVLTCNGKNVGFTTPVEYIFNDVKNPIITK